jgi:uncharacterized circularly permuted ATP-grasp superfamily protein
MDADHTRAGAGGRHLPPYRRRLPRPLGVPGGLHPGGARARGGGALGPRLDANAIGTGVADDKALYAYVPAIIRYYLGEGAVLPNVPTVLGSDPDGLATMLEGAANLVIQEVGGSGGYGMLIGPESTREERAAFLTAVKANPSNYIAQPVIQLSTQPAYRPEAGVCEPCHVGLRPFVLVGDENTVVPGGLTRVALKKGSVVVNSSQGGGSKDTWVLGADEDGEG